MMPNKAGSSYQRTKNAVGPTEVDEINRQRAEQEALKRIANMGSANKGPVVYDSFGYVVAQVAQKIQDSPPKAEKQDTKRERSDRDRDRDRDREKDRDRDRDRNRDRAQYFI
jgi:hypothetical protein